MNDLWFIDDYWRIFTGCSRRVQFAAELLIRSDSYLMQLETRLRKLPALADMHRSPLPLGGHISWILI